MITCSGCHQTLPDWAQKCQFCGADVTKVARPVAVTAKSRPLTPTASWIWPVYYSLCAYWVISGMGHAADTYHTAITPVKMEFMGIKETMEAPGFGSFAAILGFGVSIFRIVVGIGLAARLEFARGIANFLAGLSILFGVLGLAGSLIGTMFAGPWGLVLALMNTLDIVVGGMTIYLIGETEKNAPNF